LIGRSIFNDVMDLIVSEFLWFKSLSFIFTHARIVDCFPLIISFASSKLGSFSNFSKLPKFFTFSRKFFNVFFVVKSFSLPSLNLLPLLTFQTRPFSLAQALSSKLLRLECNWTN